MLPHAVTRYDKTYSAPGHKDLIIPDMHHVQYDYIYLEMFGAMKEMLSQLDALKAQVASLETQLSKQRP